MEAENKLYADMHGNSGGQLSEDPPQYTATPLQQPASQGYPPYPSTTAGAPYYAPPSGAWYGGGYGAQPQQQQQQVTVVAANSPAPVYVYPLETYTGAIVYSCIVLWCCNFIFGVIAYVLASNARDTAVTDPQGARKLGRASYIVSTLGIVASVVIVVIIFTVDFTGCHYYDGECYQFQSSSYTHSQCWAKGGVYSHEICYYN